MAMRIKWKDFGLGAAAMFVVCLIPVVGSKIVEVIGKIRNSIGSK